MILYCTNGERERISFTEHVYIMKINISWISFYCSSFMSRMVSPGSLPHGTGLLNTGALVNNNNSFSIMIHHIFLELWHQLFFCVVTKCKLHCYLFIYFLTFLIYFHKKQISGNLLLLLDLHESHTSHSQQLNAG